MLYKMPIVLLVMILSILFLDKYLPIELKSFLLTISLSSKSLIIFLLPLVIFSLLFKAAMNLSHSPTKIIMLILGLVCCSNFLSTIISYFIGAWVYHFNLSLANPKDLQVLTPYWSFELPKIISNDYALFGGLVLGILATSFKPRLAFIFANYLEKIVGKILSCFTFMLPFFIIGFIVKLKHEEVIANIVKDYALIFTIIAVVQLSYIVLIYCVVNNFKFKKTIISLKNMIPAAVTGFSTMSSAIAMPLTIIGVENNSNHSDLGRSIIPATVNIHLIGDCLAIPIFAFAILKSFDVPMPTFSEYLVFSCYFVLAKFSVAAIPGGGIIVMLPILENHLNFNAEMASLITGLYILFDCVITCTNVLGNGGFALIINKIRIFLTRQQSLRAREREARASSL